MTPEQFVTIANDVDAVLNKHGFQIGFASSGSDCEMRISVEPQDKFHSRCLRCGKALKNPVAQERGYGEVCWKKHLTDKQTTLF